MDVTILNTDLDAVSIVDTYESFIWTDRYYAYGDFELYEAMRDGLLDYIKQDYYNRKFFKTSPTSEELYATAIQYGLTETDIQSFHSMIGMPRP